MWIFQDFLQTIHESQHGSYLSFRILLNSIKISPRSNYKKGRDAKPKPVRKRDVHPATLDIFQIDCFHKPPHSTTHSWQDDARFFKDPPLNEDHVRTMSLFFKSWNINFPDTSRFIQKILLIRICTFSARPSPFRFRRPFPPRCCILLVPRDYREWRKFFTKTFCCWMDLPDRCWSSQKRLTRVKELWKKTTLYSLNFSLEFQCEGSLAIKCQPIEFL